MSRPKAKPSVSKRRIRELELALVALKAAQAPDLGASDTTRAFASSIAHELNNLLQTITSKAEMVLEDPSVSDQMHALWQSTSDTATRCAGLTRQLAEFGATGKIVRPGPAPAVTTPARSPSSSRRETRRAVRRPYRILIAEDQDSIQELIRAVLTKAGYRVTAVANGAEAVAALKENSFDLVMMDIQMPVMDGLTATRAIRQLPGASSTVPIIAASSAAMLANADALFAAGIDDYIGKPFKSVALVEKIHSWLNRDAAPHMRRQADVGGNGSAKMLVELEGLMGTAWLQRGLTSLVARIDELSIVDEAAAGVDPAAIGKHAHALVSLAGLLGFLDLSRHCTVLEEATQSRRAVVATLSKVKAVAATVRLKAIEKIDSR